MYGWLIRTLVYLGRTRQLGVHYSNRGNHAYELRCYADSNWTETRSTTAFVIMLAGATISHVSKRQHCITMSSCEAELIALCDCAIELLYIAGLSGFLGLAVYGAIKTFTDNKGAYDLCHRYTSAQHSRHVDRSGGRRAPWTPRPVRSEGCVNGYSHLLNGDFEASCLQLPRA